MTFLPKTRLVLETHSGVDSFCSTVSESQPSVALEKSCHFTASPALYLQRAGNNRVGENIQ